MPCAERQLQEASAIGQVPEPDFAHKMEVFSWETYGKHMGKSSINVDLYGKSHKKYISLEWKNQ